VAVAFKIAGPPRRSGSVSGTIDGAKAVADALLAPCARASSTAIASGAGVADVLRTLADEVRNPVVLSHEVELLYTAPREHFHATVASAWEAATRGLPQAPPMVGVPVAASGGPHWGLASVLALDRPLEPFDRVAMERAVPMLALAFVRANEAEALSARDRGSSSTR
jgi:purine catabolism regulator